MVPADQARAALDRILTSDTFAKAGRLSQFLRFVTERTLAGEAAEIKEYLIGTEVFGRSPDFDPRLDPIVRVEARRLRAKMQEYYDGAGAADPVRIALPKGGYSTVFETAPTVTAEPDREIRRQWRWQWVAVLAVAAAGISAGVVALRQDAGPPPLIVAVLPFGDDAAYSDSLCESISAELSRNPQARVIAWPRVVSYRTRHGSLDLEDAIADLKAEAALVVSVKLAGNRRRITALLMNPAQGWKKWAGEYERGIGDDFAVQREVARAVAEELRGRLVP